MALRMMSAILPSTHNVEDDIENRDHAAERQQLLDDLLAVAKKCHVRFGGRAELATESDSCITQLCHTFELIFSHGLRTNCMEKIGSALRHVSDLVSGGTTKLGSTADVPFWPCIKEQLTWHEQDRFTVLKNVHTDYGRGRAWLRAVLNERSLERHLHAIINPDTLRPFYEEWAFLLDQEKSCTLPNIAAGLGTILFAIRVDNEELDNILKKKDTTKNKISQSEPIISSTVPNALNIKQEKQKKKIHAHIISFDNEDEEQNVNESSTSSVSAPPTCLNSPTVLSNNCASLSLDIPKTFSEEPKDSSGSVDDKSSNYERCNKTFEEEKVLTPVNDVENMGTLLPVLPLDPILDDILITLPNHVDDAAEVTETVMDPFASSESRVDPDKLDIDSLRIRLLAISELLEQTREDATASRLQLARLQRQHQNYLERHELQLQTLNRENELLRQQLRKYVTAVQMLRRDSNSTISDDDPTTLDYHNEAQQYEEKLIQVAEMHAELMEFNARLTMQLNNRNQLVKLLQAELECLRGPISEDDLPSEPPCLIHIWIPSAFLTGPTSDVHHVYQIYIRIRDTEWNIYRRYAQFHTLYRELKKHDSIVTTFDFPPKKTIGNKDAKFVEERRVKLQQWLRQVVGRFAQCSPAFSSRPCRQTFITLLPFFSDNPHKEDTRKNNTTANNFSPSSQYMGL